MKKAILMIFLVLAGVADVSARDIKKKIEPFDRGIQIPKACFIPQGSIGGGLSLSYNNYNLGNGFDDSGYQALFSLVQNIHGGLHSFGVSPFVSYFIKDNISIGATFDYSRAGFELNTTDINLGDLVSFNLDKFAFLSQSYMGSIALRNYIPFNEGKRFAMFAELRFSGGYAQKQTYHIDGGDKFGTYQDIYKFSIGVVPGLTAFVTNELAIEASIGILGYEYNKTIQTTNQVEVSQMTNSNANFRLNLFSIKIGLSFYIPTGAHRAKKKHAAPASVSVVPEVPVVQEVSNVSSVTTVNSAE